MNARSVEQLVDLDDHEVYDWPWLYGVEVGHWDLTDDQAKTMRETSPTTWEFDITGTGFDATFGLTFAVV